MKRNSISLEFVSYTDSELAQFARNVATSLAKNTAFKEPPLSPAELAKRIDEFDKAAQAALQGGAQSTAIKQSARADLIAALRTLADYVQAQSNRELSVMLSSGFYVTSTSRVSGPLDTPRIAKVDNCGSTKLMLRVDRVTNARSVPRAGEFEREWHLAGRGHFHAEPAHGADQSEPGDALHHSGPGDWRQHRVERMEHAGGLHVHVTAALHCQARRRIGHESAWPEQGYARRKGRRRCLSSLGIDRRLKW